MDGLSLVFLLLVSLLMPIVLFFFDLELGPANLKLFIYYILLYAVIGIFLTTSNLLTFYISYELIIGVVFLLMYMTSNSRGIIEALLFFIGWATVGSIFVALVVFYLISVTSTFHFTGLRATNLSLDEV